MQVNGHPHAIGSAFQGFGFAHGLIGNTAGNGNTGNFKFTVQERFQSIFYGFNLHGILGGNKYAYHAFVIQNFRNAIYHKGHKEKAQSQFLDDTIH
jgi:hypothetical protein